MPSGSDVVAKALTKVGAPYVLSHKGPDSFDCSGLWFWALGQVGIPFPVGTANHQMDLCEPISVAQALATPGAMVAYDGHNAISLGDGRTVEARNPQYGVGVNTAAFNRLRFTRGGLVPGVTYNLETTRMQKIVSPAVGRVTSAFGARAPLPYHYGLDIASPKVGTPAEPVLAMAAGEIVRVVAGRAKGAGIGKVSNGVQALTAITSGDGSILRFHEPIVVKIGASTVRVIGQRSVHVGSVVSVGDHVEAGQLIGRTNLSGGTSNYHVHLELEIGTGAYDVTNPGPVFAALGLTPGKAGSTGDDTDGGFLMGLSDEKQNQIYDILVGGSQTALAERFADVLLDRPIAAGDGRVTNLRATTGWSDRNIMATRAVIAETVSAIVPVIVSGVLNTPVPRSGGQGQTSIAATLAWGDRHIEDTRSLIRNTSAEITSAVQQVNLDGLDVAGATAKITEAAQAAATAALDKIRQQLLTGVPVVITTTAKS